MPVPLALSAAEAARLLMQAGLLPAPAPSPSPSPPSASPGEAHQQPSQEEQGGIAVVRLTGGCTNVIYRVDVNGAADGGGGGAAAVSYILRFFGEGTEVRGWVRTCTSAREHAHVSP